MQITQSISQVGKKISFISLLLISTFSFAQNALNFDGSNDFVQCPAAGPIGTASRTVEAWIRIPSTVTIQKVIVDYGDMGIGNRFTLNIINGLPRIEVGGNGFSATNAISLNAWHHIAATYDNTAATKLKLYVNGMLAASGNPSVTVATSSTNGIQIGRRNDLTGFFLGNIDEVKVWNVARTLSQIANDMSSKVCVPITGLLAYFSFDQGTANGMNAGQTSLINQANSSNNGTLTGFALNGTTSNFVSGNIMTNLNATIIQTGSSLTASPANATYQWINCSSGNTLVAGANAQSFTPIVNGTYASIVTKNGCIDTSSCITMSVSVDEIKAYDWVSFFPNPTHDFVLISSSFLSPNTELSIMDITGRELSKIKIESSRQQISMLNYVEGIYFFELKNESGILKTFKVVKE
jgi:hypothetical protein